jgi:E3 ubiquitin-protein ligase HUWE1
MGLKRQLRFATPSNLAKHCFELFQVIQSVSNAIGALCLNEIGQAQVARRPSLIPGIFSIFTSETHHKVLLEKENAVMVGTSIDELVRHHPGLKNVVFDSVKSTLTKIEQMGREFQAPDDIKQWYLLSADSKAPAHNDVDVTMEDPNISSVTSGPAIAGQAEESIPGEDENKDESRPHDNFVVACIDAFGRVSLIFEFVIVFY